MQESLYLPEMLAGQQTEGPPLARYPQPRLVSRLTQRQPPTPPICEAANVTTVIRSGIFENGAQLGGATYAVASLLVTLWNSAPTGMAESLTNTTELTISTMRRYIIWILNRSRRLRS